MDIRTRILLEVGHIRRREAGDRSTRADNARSESGHGSVASTVSRCRSRLAERSMDSQYRYPFDQQYRRHQPTLPPGSEDRNLGRSQQGWSLSLCGLWMMRPLRWPCR
jgi:hypothetical protein